MNRKGPRKAVQKRSQLTVEAIFRAALQVLERGGAAALTTTSVAPPSAIYGASLAIRAIPLDYVEAKAQVQRRGGKMRFSSCCIGE